MHLRDRHTEVLTDAVLRYAVDRIRMDPPPLDSPKSPEELRAEAGDTITAEGIGGLRALELFAHVLAPGCISTDHPRFLSFVPSAPTEAAVLFDLVVGASSVYSGSWLEGSGAVFAENEALRWVADLAGFPPSAGGVFVAGGTAGNLSALIVARHRWRAADPARSRTRAMFVSSNGAHSSIAAAARVMDADVALVAPDSRGRLTAAALRETITALDPEDRARLCAIVATGGTTNVGVVDDLAGAADVAAEFGLWLHVDGAYGAAALAAPSRRALFDGIERADSFIVDPHKWLFAPFDCCALVYREPFEARRAHAQHAEYLDVLHGADEASEPWNPSDFAHHLSRRARGLPLWFSLATYGTDAYRDAVETCIRATEAAAAFIGERPYVELVLEPELSVVMFRRVGWTPAEYQAWSDRALAEEIGFVVPSSWHGETVLRFCFVNPLTTADDVRDILDSLA